MVRDDLPVGRVEILIASAHRRRALGEHRRVGEIMLHDEAENGGLQMLPFALVLGDGDEILAEEHAASRP